MEKKWFGLFGAAAAGAAASMNPAEKAPEAPSTEEVALNEKVGFKEAGDGMIEVPEPDVMPGSEGSEAALPPEDRSNMERSGYTPQQIDNRIAGTPESIGGEPDSMTREQIEKLDNE